MTTNTAAIEATQIEGAERAQRRSLGRRLLNLALLVVVAYVIFKVIPGLENALGDLGNASFGWLVLAFAIETASEGGYALAWRGIIDPTDQLAQEKGHLSAKLAWAQLAASMVNPVGFVGGVAMASMATKRLGMDQEGMLKRQGVLFLLNTAVAVLAIISIGTLMALGVLRGSDNLLLTLLPATLALTGFLLVLFLSRRVQGKVGDERKPSGRIISALTTALRGVTASVDGTMVALRDRGRGLIGATIYLGLDMLVLWIAFPAVGVPQPYISVVAMGYLIGALGGSIPLPANLGAVGGMAGMLAVYGVDPEQALVAVLVYQAVSMSTPLIGGAIAYLLLRREFGEVVEQP